MSNEKPMNKQAELVQELFSYLDYIEETDEGRVWHPIHISCSRVMMLDKVDKCLKELKQTLEVIKCEQ